jgi:hypothetical protein
LYDRIFTFSVFGRIWGRNHRCDTMFSQFRQLFP